MSAVVTLKKGEGRMVKSGGMWIFDNEIESVMGTFENGDLVLVHDFDGYPMGIGFINRNSKIRVRLFSRKEDTVIDEDYELMAYSNTIAAGMGIPEKDGRHLILSRGIWRGRFPAGTGY